MLLVLCSISIAAEEKNERTIEYYKDFPSEGVTFFEKMKTCSKAKYLPSLESVYGKTKNGKCHYSYKVLDKGDYVEYHCMLPMQTSLAYATTSLDIIEYSSKGIDELADERLKQNNQILKIIYDYCKIKVK